MAYISYMKITGIIVIDGSDGTGKTTLAQYFVSKYGAVWLHQSYRFKNKMFTYHTAALLRAIKLAETRLVVIDRLWLSEDIYGAVYRGGSAWPMEGRFIDRILLKHAAVQIIALADLETYASSFKSSLKTGRNELYTDKPYDVAKRYHDVYYGSSYSDVRTYADFLSASGGFKRREDVMGYSMFTDGKDLDKFCRRVISTLTFLKENQYQPCLKPGYTLVSGNASMADFILVGDTCNKKSRRELWPFYDYGYSSLYLNQALQLAKVQEQNIMLTNACTSAGVIHVADLMSMFKPKHVIALGKRAHARLADANIVHSSIVHPQYHRRFIGQVDGYAKIIADCMLATKHG